MTCLIIGWVGKACAGGSSRIFTGLTHGSIHFTIRLKCVSSHCYLNGSYLWYSSSTKSLFIENYLMLKYLLIFLVRKKNEDSIGEANLLDNVVMHFDTLIKFSWSQFFLKSSWLYLVLLVVLNNLKTNSWWHIKHICFILIQLSNQACFNSSVVSLSLSELSNFFMYIGDVLMSI